VAEALTSSDASVVLVTGGSRGIGAAIVRQCLEDGYAVCFTYAHDGGAAEQLVTDLDVGPRLAAVRADVTSEADTTRAFDAAESLGRLTGLVTNAGVTGDISPFVAISLEQTRRVIDVNLYAPILASRLAAERWLPDPTGRSIVTISSVAATLGAPHEYIPYAATKAAVETLTVGLAKELGPSGIRVNAVSPGTIDTTIHAAAGEPGRPERVVSRIPLGRIGQPAEIAAAVSWLLSSNASYVSGAVLRVAGGL
jgi:NAD(P)-dependent dehydrogenase (short-subunit alcohol dehydrogenase family)